MNIDQLKDEWAARDRKLEQALAANQAQVRALMVDAARATSATHRFELGIEALAFTVTVLCLGSFIGHHAEHWRAAAPAVLMLAWTIALEIRTLAQRAQLRALDYGQPVLALQRALEQIRVQRMQTFRWAFLSGIVVWSLPLKLVLAQALAGIDLFAVAPSYAAADLAISAALVPAAWFIARVLGRKFQGSPRLQAVIDSLAGSDVASAREFMQRLAQFEKESALQQATA